MDAYSHTLEKYNGIKSRHTCPECGGKHQFARYVDGQGNYVADHVGRCNREAKCNYHLTPKQYFEQNPNLIRDNIKRVLRRDPIKPVQYVSAEILKSTLKGYDSNTFVNYLRSIFEEQTVHRLIDAYGIGTTKDGSCIFWQVDIGGKIRTGKVIKYKPDGHRDKELPPYFIHSKLKLETIEQCLFGLHLLSNDPIGLVESEKTAVLMAGQLPQFTWMATGGKSSSIETKVRVLRGKKVVVFPDSDAHEEWSKKLSVFGFKISNALIKNLKADEVAGGLDIADFVTTLKLNETEFDLAGCPIDPVLGYPQSWIQKPKSAIEKMIEINPLVADFITRLNLDVR
jgi:hypothetical protein